LYIVDWMSVHRSLSLEVCRELAEELQYTNMCSSLETLWLRNETLNGFTIHQVVKVNTELITKYITYKCSSETIKCHQGMAHPRVADRGQLRMCWISSSGYLRRCGSRAWGFGEGLTIPRNESGYYEMLHQATDLDGFFGTTKATECGYEIWHMKCRRLCRAGSPKSVWRKLAKYNSEIWWRYKRSDGSESGGQSLDECTSFCGNGNPNYHLGTGFFVYKGIISAIKRVDFISDRIACCTKRSLMCYCSEFSCINWG
jgi:hypothetical protein